MTDGLDCLTPLFVPGGRPERFGEAAASGADAIIAAPEDAVAPDAKAAARAGIMLPKAAYAATPGFGGKFCLHPGQLARTQSILRRADRNRT